MANKKCFVTLLICIFLLVNLCSAIEKFDSSFDDDKSATDKGLDWWHSWFRFYPWFRPHPFPFVHPPMPAGGFRYKFPHPWPFMHPPKSSSSEGENMKDDESATAQTDENASAQTNKGLDWWYPWFGSHPWFRFHPHPWPFVHPPMAAGGFGHRFPHPWPFMHPPKPSSSEEEKN
ncbi:unnamed protein product [Withania somnifera]